MIRPLGERLRKSADWLELAIYWLVPRSEPENRAAIRETAQEMREAAAALGQIPPLIEKWRADVTEAVETAKEAERKGLMVTAGVLFERGNLSREHADELETLIPDPPTPRGSSEDA